jgi:hypothetical protein
LLDDGLGSGSSEDHLVHGAKDDTPLVHDDVLPGGFGFAGASETI